MQSVFGDFEPINPFTLEPITEKRSFSQEEQDAYQAFQERYRNDTLGFVTEVLGAKPFPWQRELIAKIEGGSKRISVRAGHRVGKSTVCAWLLLKQMLTCFPQKAVCTAPSASQLYDALFAEVKAWVNKLPDYLKNQLEVRNDRITLAAAPNESFISARTSSADRPESLAGVHAPWVLIICDEASGIPEPIFEVAQASMAGENAVTILISNPTRNSGTFFRSHHELAGDVWDTMHVSCLDVPENVAESFVRDMATSYGEDSNQYRIRVLGEFPTQDDDTLIPASHVDGAMKRTLEGRSTAPLVYGVDVARSSNGDRQVICKRRGDKVLGFVTSRGLDLMEFAGAIKAHADEEKPAEICIDANGMGWGVYDACKHMGLPVRAVMVSESSSMNPQAERLRDDLWLQVKKWLATNIADLPDHPELREELVGPRFSHTPSGKLKVESKDSMKKRGIKSPDLADALCLTFASVAAKVGGQSSMWNRPLRRRIPNILR